MSIKRREYLHRKYRHQIHRAWERYGVAMHPGDIKNLEREIWKGKARWLLDDTDRMVQYYLVKFRQTKMIAVFSISTGEIATFLPKFAKVNGGDCLHVNWSA